MATDVEILDMAERWDFAPVGILADLKHLRGLLKNRNYGDQPAIYHLVDILIKHFEKGDDHARNR